MVILAAAIVVSLVLGFVAGGTFRNLERLHFRGEALLVAMLAAQTVLPLLRLEGLSAQLAYAVWFGTFPVMVLVCLLNYRTRGLLVAAAGLMLNMLVIGLNGGMPVSPVAAQVVSQGASTAIRSGDFVHVVMGEATRLGVLADVLPIPGPVGLRSVASAGDVLLICGVAGVVAAGMLSKRGNAV